MRAFVILLLVAVASPALSAWTPEELARTAYQVEFGPHHYTMRGSDLARECLGVRSEVWCQAAVEAVMAQHEATAEQSAAYYCLPPSTSARWPQGRAALVAWLPAQRAVDLQALPAGLAVLAALRHSYPCRKP